MKYFYAELHDSNFTDLWRFTSKKERDQFVADRADRSNIISAKLAKKYHKDQFLFWSQQK